MSDMHEFPVPAGTVIHLGGLPFELSTETTIRGSVDNFRLLLSGGATKSNVHAAGPKRPRTQRPLTGQQRKALDFIKKYTAEHGVAPTSQEIGAAIGYQKGAVASAVVRAPHKKGFISTGAHREYRGIRVLAG